MKICLPARRNIAAGSMKEKVPVAEAGREHEGNAESRAVGQRKEDEEGGTGDWTEEGKIVPASL